jgi:hypothetical protein
VDVRKWCDEVLFGSCLVWLNSRDKTLRIMLEYSQRWPTDTVTSPTSHNKICVRQREPWITCKASLKSRSSLLDMNNLIALALVWKPVNRLFWIWHGRCISFMFLIVWSQWLFFLQILSLVDPFIVLYHFFEVYFQVFQLLMLMYLHSTIRCFYDVASHKVIHLTHRLDLERLVQTFNPIFHCRWCNNVSSSVNRIDNKWQWFIFTCIIDETLWIRYTWTITASNPFEILEVSHRMSFAILSCTYQFVPLAYILSNLLGLS